MEESYFSELVSVEPNQIKARANTNVYLVIGLQISNGFDIFHWSDGGWPASFKTLNECVNSALICTRFMDSPNFKMI